MDKTSWIKQYMVDRGCTKQSAYEAWNRKVRAESGQESGSGSKVRVESQGGQKVDKVDIKRTSSISLYKPDGRFEGHGRGKPVDGMVLVSVGLAQEDYMMDQTEWSYRMDKSCLHGLFGVSCKTCLRVDAGLPPAPTSRKNEVRCDQTTREGAQAWMDHLVAKDGIKRKLEQWKSLWLVRRVA